MICTAKKILCFILAYVLFMLPASAGANADTVHSISKISIITDNAECFYASEDNGIIYVYANEAGIKNKDALFALYAVYDKSGVLCDIAKSSMQKEGSIYSAAFLKSDFADCEEKIFFWQDEIYPAAPSLKVKSDDTVTVYPKEKEEFVKNPYNGICLYGPFVKSTNEPASVLKSGVEKYASIGYYRFSWSEIEPVEGEYKWEILDKQIEMLKQYNMQLAIGINAASITSATNYSQATPLWVFDKGAKYTLELDGSVKVPVWDDEIFMQEYSELVTALLTRYNDNKNIAFIDMRSYGNWGEWNFSNLTNSVEIDLETKKKHIDMWKNSKIPTMMLVADLQAADYAVDTLGSGMRSDGCMNPLIFENYRKLNLCYKKSPAAAEWHSPAYKGYRSGGVWEDYMPYMPIFFERTIKEGHLSYIGLGLWTSDLFFSENEELVKRMANAIGYRFVISEATYPKNITDGRLEMTVKNDGVAPFYGRKSSNAALKLAIFDGDDNIIAAKVISGADPKNFADGEYSKISFDYSFDNAGAAKKIGVGIFSDITLDKPDIQFCSEGEVIDGYSILNSMPKVCGNFAENRIYNAGNEGYELGKGFLCAENAFKDNNSDCYTFDGIYDNTLEIDMGNVKNIKGVRIDIKENYENCVSVYADGVLIKTVNSLLSGENDILFEQAVSCRKILLKFNKMSDIETAENELMINGDAERDVLVYGGWYGRSGGKITNVSSPVFGGNSAVKVYGQNSQYSSFAISVTDILKENGAGKYHFSFNIKAESADTAYVLQLRIYDKNGKSVQRGNFNMKKDEWSKCEADIDIDWNEALYEAAIYIDTVPNSNSSVNTQDYYVDNVSITKIG